VKRGRQATGRWAIAYDACLECKTTDRAHRAHGLCVNCYTAATRGNRRRLDRQPPRSLEERHVAARGATQRYRIRKAYRERQKPLHYEPIVWPLGIKPMWQLTREGNGCQVCGGDLLLDPDGDYRCLMCSRVEARSVG